MSYIYKFDDLDGIKSHEKTNIQKSKYDHKSGYVYLIEFDNNCIKIGSTKDAHKRIKTILNGNFNEFKHIYVSNICNNYRDIENIFKKQFRKIVIKGTEWFELDENIDYYIDVLKKYNYDYNFMTEDDRNEYLKDLTDRAAMIIGRFNETKLNEEDNFDSLDMFEILIKEMKNQRDKIKDQDNKIIELESKFNAMKDALG